MRRVLVIPLLFLLILCLTLFVFVGLDLLVFGASLAETLLRVPASLLGALPAAVLVSLAALSFRRPEGVGLRFLSFITIFACALAALGPGFRGLLSLLPEAAAPPAAAGALFPQRINRLGEALVYVDSLPAGRPSGVVLYTTEGGLQARDHASLRREGDEIVVLLPDGTRAARGPAEPARAALFRFHPQVEALLADIRLLNAALRQAERESTARFLLLSGSLAFFLSAALFLLGGPAGHGGGNGWPLLRVISAFLLVRGILFLHAVLETGITDEVRKLLPGSAWAPTLTTAFLLLAGALCLLGGLLAAPVGAAVPRRRGAGGRREALRG